MRTSSSISRQRGVASLIVVAVLFFILSLVAAYTNRNLIFEQRTSGNQYRSTQAFEAAEAGVEWALSLLNSGRISAACAPSSNTADTSFRQRYLSIDPTTGVVIPAGTLTAGFESTVWPSCVFNGVDWNCSCPSSGAPAVTAPVGTGVFPAFRVRFVRVSTTQPSLVRLEVNGCTRLSDACLDFPAQAVGGEGRASVSVLVALRGGLPAPPVAALTVRGNLNVGGAALGAFNADDELGGISILAGGTISGPNRRAGSAPGSPSALSEREDDPGLLALAPLGAMAGERLFTNTFSTWANAYRDQPGAVVLDCSTACDADAIRNVATLNPGRVVWAEGDVDLDTGAIGSATEPLVIITTGSASVGGTLHGLLYSRANTWASGGGGEIHGAAIAENAFGGNASFSVVYDADVLSRLRWQTGSFVRVPGGWRDF